MATPSSGALGDAPVVAAIAPALLVALQAAVFMVSAEARVISPLLPAIAGDFAISIPQAGILVTAYTLPYGLFQLVYGPLADRFPRQRVMGFALSLFAIGTLLSGVAPNMPLLTLLRFLSGAAAAGVIPIALAYVGDSIAYDKRQAVLAQVIGIAALGGVLSSALGGVVAQWINWRALFLLYGVIAMLVGAVLLRLPVQRAASKAARSGGMLGPYRAIFAAAGRRAWELYGLVCFEGFAAFSTFTFLGAFLFERYGFDYGVIGLLLMLNGVGNLLASRWIGRLVRRLGERGMLLLGGTLMTFAYLIVWLQPVLLFFPLAMLVSGAGFAIAHSTLQARATELVPTLRGTAVALFAFSLFFGASLGTIAAGYGIERLGYVPVILASAALLGLFTLVAGRKARAAA
ncbi:MAG: MFS transporter [Roseiflexaceae bacterium]|nr:MFS transporter [Roseiflexaceae bacterium]